MRQLLSWTFLKKCYRFLGPTTCRYMSWGAAIGVLLFAVELAFAYGLQSFLIVIDVLSPAASRLPSWIPREGVWPVLGFVCAIGVVRGLLQWVQVYFLEIVVEAQKCEQRRRIVDYAFRSKSVNTSEVVTLFNEQAHAAGLMANQLETIVIRITGSFFIFLWPLWSAPIPTLVFTGSLGVVGLMFRKFDEGFGVSGRAVVSDWSKISSRITTNIRNLVLMQIYGTQERERQQVRERIDSYEANYKTYSYNAGLVFALPHIFGIFLICMVTLLLRDMKTSSSGEIVTYFYMTVRLTQMISDIVRNAAALKFYLPRAGLLARWWADHAADGVRAKPLPPPPTTSATPRLVSPVGWTFRNVSYQYPGAKHPVLRSLSVEIPINKTTAITGPSGAGKSTLVNLMLGNLEPQSGTIELQYFEGSDRTRVKSELLQSVQSELFRVIGYVSSDPFIIEGSVRENICYALGREPTQAEMDAALGKAECQFIFEPPQGLEHRLTEQGQGLSAGQKQRLSLARALLRKPKVLILDEATSNLDFETEGRLIETFREFKGDMTIVAVTHRPALLQLAEHRIEIQS